VTTTEETLKRLKLELPLRIALLYLLFGGLWILLSDRILFLLVSHEATVTTYQTLKGWFFILVSGSLLYLLLLTQQIRDRETQERAAWLASFPERNPNPVVEIDPTGTIFYMNPAAESEFPDLRALGFKHPWLMGLEDVFVRFYQEGLNQLQREIQIDNLWYSQSLSYVPETSRLRLYGTDLTERKTAEQQTVRMKRLYATLSQVDQTIVRAKDQQELYQSICDVALEFGGLSLAWIGLLDELTGDVQPIASAGMDISNWSLPIINTWQGSYRNGVIAEALKTSTVVTSEEVQVDEMTQTLQSVVQKFGIRSLAAVPFRLQGKTIGVLNLISVEPGFFRAEEERNLLKEMALDISFALDTMETEAERKQAEQKIERQNKRLKVLREIDMAILAADSMESIVSTALSHVRELMDCQRANLTLIDWGTYEAEIFEVRMVGETSILKGGRFPLEQYEDIIQTLSQNQPILFDDLRTLEDPKPAIQTLLRDGLRSMCSLPLFSQGNLIGMFSLYSEIPGFFDEERVDLGREVANQTAIAITQSLLLEGLREHEERLRLSLYAANQGLYDLNVQTGEAIVNREYGEMLGYDPETFVETNAAWIERLHPDDRESVAKAYTDYVSGALPEYRVEFRQRMKNGDWKWILSLGKVIEWDAAGKALRMLGTHTDITEAKRAEEELKESEAIFSSFLEHSPVFIFFKDQDIRALRLSKNYEQMLGMPLDRALGKTMDELFPSDLAKSMVADDMRILNEGRQVDVVEQLGDRIYETTKFPIMKDGKPIMLAGFTVDITERRRAEEALRASEERFRLLFENNHTVMMLIEPVSGAIRDANQAAAEFYGYSLADLRCMNINEINQLTPEEVYAERMLALSEARNYFNFQHRLCNAEIRAVEVHSAPVEIEGSILLFSIVHDITERKRVEEENQARSRQLAALLDASQSLTESLNLAEVMQKITDKATNVLMVEKASLYLVEGQHLYLGASTPPLPIELPEDFRRANLADHPHIAEALSTGQPIILADTSSAALIAPEKLMSDALGLRTIMYVPVTGRKDLAAILILGAMDTLRDFSRDDEDLARALANQASLALANARLYQDVSLHLRELENQIVERRQAQEQFHMVVESAPNAIMLVSSNGRVRLVNAQVENYFGYDRTELIGMDVHELIPHRFRQQHPVQLAEFLKSPHPRPMGMGRDLYGLRKNGSEFPAEIGITLLDSSDESLVMVTIVDITTRKQAEEGLKRHINYLTCLREVDQAITSSFDIRLSLNILATRTVPLLKVDAAAILLLDPVMNTLEYAAGYGFRRNILHTGSIRLGESYAGKVVMERRMIKVPNLRNALHDGFHKGFLKEENFVTYYGVPLIVKGKVVGVMEVFHRMPVSRDQEWFDFLISLAGQAAIAIDNARLWEQVQRHARDLELRVAERTAALNRTNAELEYANRAKDEFLANMSHELRTPLNSILGLAESLLEQRRDSITDYQQRSLQIIESSGHHLLELINDILDLSKIEAGKLDYYPQVVELDALCRSSLTFVKNQAVRKSITITYTNETSIANIAADPRRLKQILVNLLTNAVKFTPEGGQVALEVHVDEEQDLVEFSVADNGIGIAPQDLKHLFQPFVQVDSKLNRQFEGTGLGLALVHKLTDMHGGSVNVESHVGAGSRFTVRLPWGQKLIAQQATDGLAREVLSDHPEKSNLPSDARVVLLAEDNLASILTISEYLKSHGYRFAEAHDGLEAIEKAEANDPSIILMDIQMPVLDGLEAIRRLRANPRFAGTPIIALTALAMPGDRERCLEAGASEYITKPIRLKLLKQIMEDFLQEK
jgi:PAS domain S-box-containing protein